jgi:hypothetical protein
LKNSGFSLTTSLSILFISQWNNRLKLWALVKQVPRSGDLTRVYPRRMEIVEEALYRAIKEEVVKGM